MKNILILLATFFLFISVANAEIELHCNSIKELSGLCFDIEFAVTTDIELNIPAKYNFPYFIRAGDYLYIKKIKVFNLDNSTKVQPGQLVLDIKPIDYSDLPYTDLKKVYPTNYGTFTFNIKALEPKFSCEITLDFERKTYTTNCGEKFTGDRLYVDLFKEGEWVIVDQYTPTNKSLGSWGHTSIINSRWRGNTFKVTSGFEMDNLKDLKRSLNLVVLSLILTICFTLISIYLQWKNLTKKEEGRIRVKIFVAIIVSIIISIAGFIWISKIT